MEFQHAIRACKRTIRMVTAAPRMKAQPDIRPPYRIPLLALGFACLVIGVGTGLFRLGWNFPLPKIQLAAMHGPLMVCGFFGTLIALERAVAIARRWAYLGPLFAGLGGVAIISGTPIAIAQLFLTLGSLILLGASVRVFRQQAALFTFTLALGAGCWVVGNLLWLAGLPMQNLVPWWLGFLLVTIAGERLELSRFRPLMPGAKYLFGLIIGVLVTGMILSTSLARPGEVVIASAEILLAIWLLRHDIARRTVQLPGLTRFIAVCMLSGYGWLMTAGLITLATDVFPAASLRYDAALHALTLGFTFSMVFGHALIIFPAVARITVPYRTYFYIPLVALHLSLSLRIAGDLFAQPAWRSIGGALNALTLMSFILFTVFAVAGRKWSK
jgi:hypothetical protein